MDRRKYNENFKRFCEDVYEAFSNERKQFEDLDKIAIYAIDIALKQLLKVDDEVISNAFIKKGED